MNKFAHLHVYTGFTNPEGVCDIRLLAEKAKDLGMKALAITDKNVMFGVPDFIQACKRFNLKPIVGCEVTVGTADERYDLVLLCENMTGYKNLVRLVSNAWLQSDGVSPVVTFDALDTHSEGLIALCARPDGKTNAPFLRGDKEKAKAAALRFRRIFGAENFFIELQDHSLPEDNQLQAVLADLAKETGVQTVAANAVCYIDKTDAVLQKIRACIALGLSEQEYAGKGLQTDEYYLKSEEEMIKCFYGYEDAVINAGKIAERCACPDLFRWFSVPLFQTPNGKHAGKYFRELCLNGLKERMGGVIPPEYKKRLEEEILYIRKMGYADYFLLIWDAVQYAKSVGIPVGPGREPAPGCLALYVCGVTEVDPIKHGLSFERFMNPERITTPDIDIDVAPQDRDRLIRYLKEKYGEERVFSVCSLRTGYSEIHAIQEIGRVLGIEKKQIYDFLDKIGVNRHYFSIVSAIHDGEVAYYRSFHRPDKRLDRLIGLVYDFYRRADYNLLYSVGVHPCKLAILTDETVDLIPLIKNEDGVVMTQYEKTWALERFGALDVDFTPLNVLGTLDAADKCIREKEPDFRLDTIDLADKETFDMLRMGKTESVFSFENESMRELLKEAFPNSMADLAALYSLDRPGMEDIIPDYLAAKLHPETVTYRTPELEPILKETCGVILYQEQVMEILHTLAGYSMGRADLVRRAIAKKIRPDVLELQREIFVYGNDGKDDLPACDGGCLKRGIDEETANAVFDDIEKYCPYAFNKSHAVSYALLAYRTAYLKCHYPEEWNAAIEKTAAADN